MAVSWFTDYPATGPWERSTNSGGTWVVYPSGSPNIGQVNGPTGTVRFRQLITVPPGVTEDFLRLFIRGDLYHGPLNIPGEVRVDGALIAQLTPPAQSFTGPGQYIFVPISSLPPGPHSVEIWVGQSNAAGNTFLNFVQAALITAAEPCNCGSPTWIPAVADSQTGWSAPPQTTHVDALSGNPTFTIAGPVRGIRFRSPDFGGPAIPNADGAIGFNITTLETGLIDPSLAGWAPAIPAFPAAASAGPYSRVFSGITVTVNADGRLTQRFAVPANLFRLAKQNANPPASPEFEWITIEFSQPVTNLSFAGGAYQALGAPRPEGISQLQVLSDFPPCNCCPMNPHMIRCYVREELQALFTGVNIITNGGAGNSPVLPISRWIDQDISGAAFTGWNSPGVQWTETTSPQIEFTFATPFDRVTRIAEYNQGGGDLNDSDGFLSAVVDVFNSQNALIHSETLIMGNGGSPFGLTFSTPLFDVSRMVWRNMRKLNPGSTVAPLVREFQAFYTPVRYAVASLCNGSLTWFDSVTGDQVDPVNFVPCEGESIGPTLTQSWTAFDDAVGPGQQESVCNLTRLPTFTTNTNAPSAGCFGSSNNSTAQLTWEDFSTVEADYTPFPGTAAGAALFTVVLDGVTVTWPVVGELGIGASNVSNPVNGKQVRLTAVSGANGQRPRWDNATTIRIGENPVGTTNAAIRYRLEIV